MHVFVCVLLGQTISHRIFRPQKALNKEINIGRTSNEEREEVQLLHGAVKEIHNKDLVSGLWISGYVVMDSVVKRRNTILTEKTVIC